MTGSTTKKFEKLLLKLSPQIQRRTRENLSVWIDDPSHPSLLFKKPFTGKYFWSIRITRGYRALGCLENNHMYWFWIGNHDDYERYLSTL